MYIYIYIYVLKFHRSKMSIIYICAQVHELPQRQCADDRDGILFSL